MSKLKVMIECLALGTTPTDVLGSQQTIICCVGNDKYTSTFINKSTSGDIESHVYDNKQQ